MKEIVAEQLSEDLNALQNILWSTDPIHPSLVRITASSILRKWFIENWINKLSKEANVTYTFQTLNTSLIVEEVNGNSDIQFFMAGGVNMDGVPLQGYYVSDGPPNSDGTPVLSINKMEYELMKPSKIMSSNRVFFNGTWFNNSEIIKYCANKYGGVHLDFKNTKDWHSKIVEASNYFIAGNPDNRTEREIIEPYSDKHRILLVLPKETGNIWNCLDIELLAMAQSFLNIHANGEIIAEPIKNDRKISIFQRIINKLKGNG